MPLWLGGEQSQPCLHPGVLGVHWGGCWVLQARLQGRRGLGRGGGGQPGLSPLPIPTQGIWGHGSALCSPELSGPVWLLRGVLGVPVPCLGTLPSCHPGDPHGGQWHPMGPPPSACRCVGLGALGQILGLLLAAPLAVLHVGHP